METYVTDPWGCSQSPTLLLDTTGKSSDAITSDFEGGKGTVLTPAEPIRQNVSFSQNGYLTVGFRGKGDLNKAINVCYIKITDASLENPDNYVKDDLADLYFSTYCLSDNLTLPTQGKNGSVITWSSSNTSVITADGKVTRPDVGQEDKKVTLTATVSYGTTVQSKKFDFTVYAKGGLTKAEQFALNDVTLTDTYYKAAESSDLSFLKKFDNDRLLSRFRETAGVDQKGASPYKGWEDSLIGGHCVGHYLTACAQAVKATGDESLRTKLTALISGLRECQTKLNTGFVFGARIDDASNVEKQFDIVEGKDSGNTWVPWYTMHKIVQGLVDVYRYTDNQEALTVAKDLGEWIYNRVNQWDSGTQARISYTEYGGMNDCMYELYKITGNTHFRDAAHKFDDPGLYKTILSGNSNTLNKRHANTTIPKFVGALNRYVALTERGETLTEDDKAYLGYAEDFWKLVVEKHAFITGSVSDMEHFKEDHAQDSIRTQCNCESCCVHNMLKLSKELFKLTGEKKYADYYETTLRNAIMGAVNTENGTTTYFTPMASGYYKYFSQADPANNMFWCCTGSGMENYTKLGDSIYFHTNDALIVNQYVASTVTWSDKNVKLTQQSDVTKTEDADFTIGLLNGASSVNMKLYLKVPDWAAGTPTVTVNGTKQSSTISGGYICINRTWSNGDKVKITNPMKVVAYGLPDNHTVYGFMYGPTVLAAKLGTEKWNETVWAGANLSAAKYKVVGPESVALNVSYGQTTKQILGTETLTIDDGTSMADYISNIDQYMERDTTSSTLAFKIKGTDADSTFSSGLTFVPFNTLNAERYGIYWYFQGSDEASEGSILENKEEGRFAASIIDSIQPGYGQYENDNIHQMKESNTEFANLAGVGSTRYAKVGGYFEYNMIVKKGVKNRLLCQFAKEDNGKTIKIMAGGQVIATETLNYTGSDTSYKKYYEIPESIVSAVSSLTIDGEKLDVIKVRFESNQSGSNSARLVAGLFMTIPYSTDARITAVTSTIGETKILGEQITVTVPKGTTTVGLNFTLADKMGLLYINGELVNDSKEQSFAVTSDAILLKVYAEDHTTNKEYTLKFSYGETSGDVSGTEIISNPGFEDGTNNWEVHESGNLGLGYTTVNSGERSLKISNRTATGCGAMQDITGKLQKGKTYTVKAAVRFNSSENSDATGETTFHMSIIYGDGTIKNMATVKTGADSWAYIDDTYTLPEDADLSSVKVFLETAYTSEPKAQDLVTFFVDDVSVKAGGSSSEVNINEQVQNSGFEDGTSKWETHDSPDLSVDNSTVKSGSCALKVTNRTTTGCGPMQDLTNKLQNGKTYAVKAAIRFNSSENAEATGETTFHISIIYGDGTIKNMGTVKIGADKWGLIDTTYTVPEDADLSSVKVFLETAYTSEPKAQDLVTFYVDDISIQTAENEDTDSDQTAADAVSELIRAIGTVTYDSSSKKKIDDAKSAYNKLTDAQKKLISNYSILTAAEAEYKRLEEEEKGKTDTTPTPSPTPTAKPGTTDKPNETAQPSGTVQPTRVEYAMKQVGVYQYKVSDEAKKMVTVVGTSNRKQKNIKVPDTVILEGKSYRVTAIAPSAFKSCKYAVSASIGKNVKVIGKKAFERCSKIKKVNIKSKKLKTIGTKAFYQCKKLKRITLRSNSLKKVGAQAFKRIHKKAIIKVPSKKLIVYKKLLRSKGMPKSVSFKK